MSSQPFALGALALLLSLIRPAATAAISSGRAFQQTTFAAATASCPGALSGSPAESTSIYIEEKSRPPVQVAMLEKAQLVNALQAAVTLQKLSFNSTFNPLNIRPPVGAQPRRCPPVFDFSFVASRVPSFLINVRCSAGCRQVTREVQVFERLCHGQPIYASSFATTGVECAPL